MANHFSALKRARQTTKRTEDNRSNTSRLRTALRKLRRPGHRRLQGRK